MSTFRHRLKKCSFFVKNLLSSNLVEDYIESDCPRLRGHLGISTSVPEDFLADFGAERNLMSEDFARSKGFFIKSGWRYRGTVCFADRTEQETVGQVETTLTFQSGKCVAMTFEILRNVSANVILGEDFLYDNDVWNIHQSSLCEPPSSRQSDELQPFDFKRHSHKETGSGEYLPPAPAKEQERLLMVTRH